MTARAVVNTLLETGPDEFNLRSEVNRYAKTWDFDSGVGDILDSARHLYRQLEQMGAISVLKNYRRRGSLLTGFDESSIAQAVLRMAMEKRGSKGAENAYKILRRETIYSL